MKESSNLLILGAGASMDYGFPSGADLKKRALSLLNDEQGDKYNLLARAGEKLGFDHSDLLIFSQKLKNAELDDSIDAFIEANCEDPDINKLSNIAKCIIALLIASSEEPKKLDIRPSWYYELFKKMYSGRNSYSRFFDNKINFVTFNYDRSLEQFLLNTIAKQFNKTRSDCIKSLNKSFKIIHVHGSLGKIWVDKGSVGYKEYSPILNNADDLLEAASKIKLITDKINPVLDSEFLKARVLISESDILHFIGFGYHVNNMERLGFDKPYKLLQPKFKEGEIAINKIRDDKVFGTVKGMSQQKVLECIRKYYLGTVAYIPSSSSESYGLAENVDNSTTALEYITIAPFD